AGEMARPGGAHDPFARAHRLVAFVDGVDEDEVAAVALSADAVDDELRRPVEGDFEDIVGVAAPGEEGGHVELRLFGCGERGTGGKQDCSRRGKPGALVKDHRNSYKKLHGANERLHP